MSLIAYLALGVLGAMWICLALAESMRYATRLFLAFRAKNRFAELLLAAAILGFGYSFATKPENRAGSVPSPRHVPAPYGIVAPGECDSPGFDSPTNLCISGFSALSNSVLLSMAWPDDMQPDYLDLYSSTNLRTWSRLATVDVMDCASNATVEISSAAPARFFTVADQSDHDLDGLTDAEERLVYGTDPAKYDTDGDFFNDGWEIGYGLDPCASNAVTDADSDFDGLDDSIEELLGTNPFSADTDGDGMPDGWEVPIMHLLSGPSRGGARSGEIGFDLGDYYMGMVNLQFMLGWTNPLSPDNGRYVPLGIYFGDPSSSRSEKYAVSITPQNGPGSRPQTIYRANHAYGECVSNVVFLAKGWKYRLELKHAGTDLARVPERDPDYDFSWPRRRIS